MFGAPSIVPEVGRRLCSPWFHYDYLLKEFNGADPFELTRFLLTAQGSIKDYLPSLKYPNQPMCGSTNEWLSKSIFGL